MTGGRGYFVVIEGPEGSGKSTLARGLAQRMAEVGIDPVVVREPGGTTVAEAVRHAVLHPDHRVSPLAELFLYLAARADLVDTVIRPALEQGKVVLADRFSLSTDVYQGIGRGLAPALVSAANQAAVGDAIPDLTLVVDIPPDMGLARQEAAGKSLDRLDQEHRGFHREVAAAYRRVAGPGVQHLDGTVSPEEILENAWCALVSARPETFGVVGRSGL